VSLGSLCAAQTVRINTTAENCRFFVNKKQRSTKTMWNLKFRFFLTTTEVTEFGAMFIKDSFALRPQRLCGAISDLWFARKPEDPRHSSDHDQRKRASALDQREVVSVSGVQCRPEGASAQS